MRQVACSVGLAGLLLTSGVSAYELATHGELTQKAYEHSALTADQQLLKELGVDATSTNPFGETYYDVSGAEVLERWQHNFEKGKMPNDGKDFLKVQGWLLRGAIREDDYTGEDAPNPQDDPYNTRLTPFIDERPLNHFYDPIGHRALTVTLWGVDGTGERAPDWGLGTIDAAADPEGVRRLRRNHFTVRDAREAQYRALAGRGWDSLRRDKEEKT